MNGKGKKYDENGKLIYDGEFLNNMRNGKGKEYDEKGGLKYDGEFLNNIKYGNANYFMIMAQLNTRENTKKSLKMEKEENIMRMVN